MPVFMIERQLAEELDASVEAADRINRINDQESVRWLYSFLSADRRRTFACTKRRLRTRFALPLPARVCRRI
jgi:hypothetical protein